ncbi:ribonuclease D [Gloeobacter morelensis]|uniref:Ribonuclease D n=1 Tax=Gloeobacter morelensis MG652769 TaxID=2781736 RepID=A0ABY3PQK5_9CYAN|nr:ribonuclease D [Gloeobacter morelensis]UFP96005.1 ribonuclease D [Gloeobacter morelensis MG652769]
MGRHQVPYVLVTETAQLSELVDRWQTRKVLAVDTETAHWHQVSTGKNRVSLLQVWDGTSEAVWVIDCFAVDLTAFVEKTMRNWEIVKLIHNAPYDLAYLGGAAQARSVVCTLQMARSIPASRRGALERNSLKALSAHFLGIELDKRYQASNWALRPLTAEQLDYAALDPWVTFHIWEHMRALVEPENEGFEELLV